MTKYFLGADIGASKSHAMISDDQGNILGFGEWGPGNHEVVDYHGLQEALQQITRQALEQAGLTIEIIAGAGFGVAGYDWPSEYAPTMDAIRTLGLQGKYEAVNDTIVGLLAGASQGWGVAVVAGTGCNCWGWDADHKTGHVTGMGGMFGEAAGAGELVHQAIVAISHAWSHRGPQTMLTNAFLKLAGARSDEALLEGLTLGTYHLGAGVAPLVFQVAAQGDLVAQRVIEWAGQELGELANAVIRQIAIEGKSFEVVQVGSLWEGGVMLIEPFKKTVLAVAPQAIFTRLDAPPVLGGLLLGMEQAGLDFTKVRPHLIKSVAAYLVRCKM